MTQFRPCIDLHQGRVKQIVGESLKGDGTAPKINFQSDHPAAYYSNLYRKDQLRGGHVIKLGPGNDVAAREALATYPDGLQIGGGIRFDNAVDWLQAGASHVIVTSWLFDTQGRFLERNLEQLVAEIGKDRLVIDLSCRAVADGWVVAMDRWQKKTELTLTPLALTDLGHSCDELLVHAADVEGKCEGIDEALVGFLADFSPVPVTYAGGARSVEDLDKVSQLSRGRVDLTIGSALDIFGGSGARYVDCLVWNSRKYDT
ncbi:MAG: phosphoribosylformimino-5-aminoimidazole carboxamide ribotide isomerase [Verrucomicrobiota bacterium]